MKWMFNITMVFLFLFIGLTEAHATGNDWPGSFAVVFGC